MPGLNISQIHEFAADRGLADYRRSPRSFERELREYRDRQAGRKASVRIDTGPPLMDNTDCPKEASEEPSGITANLPWTGEKLERWNIGSDDAADVGR